MQRKHDYRLIKSHRPYTVESLGKLLDVHPATIRAWIKKAGLSCAMVSDSRPIILNGAKAKTWMKARQEAKKRPCAPDEMYCVKCKEPRQIAKGSFRIKPSNSRKVIALGECVICGLTLRNFNTRSNLANLKAQYASKASND